MKEASSDMLRRIFQIPHLAAAGTTIQTRDTGARTLRVDYFLLVLVRSGTRTVRRGARVWTARPGEWLVMTPGRYSVTNVPESASEAYRSDWLAWDTGLEPADEAQAPSDLAPLDGAQRLSSVDDELEDSFMLARKALEVRDQLPHSIVKHRIQEIPLWLQVHGIHLVPPHRRSLTDRIRSMATDVLPPDAMLHRWLSPAP